MRPKWELAELSGIPRLDVPALEVRVYHDLRLTHVICSKSPRCIMADLSMRLMRPCGEAETWQGNRC